MKLPNPPTPLPPAPSPKRSSRVAEKDLLFAIAIAAVIILFYWF